MRNVYGAAFDLAVEVEAICAPLAERMVAEVPDPAALRRRVADVFDATHEVLSAVVGMLAESRNLDDGARSRTARAISDLAQRPQAPEVGDEMLCDGTWAKVLTASVEPVSADLAGLLAKAIAPGDDRLHGHPSVSERLEAVLLGGLHFAACDGLGLSRDPQRRAMGLANIRAGAAPGATLGVE
jgi:hypothetical protein